MSSVTSRTHSLGWISNPNITMQFIGGAIPSPFLRELTYLIAQYLQRSGVWDRRAWREYFGEVGEEPPLPENIDAILESPCAFHQNQRVRDTHRLVLIPKTIDNVPFTLKTIGYLAQNSRRENPTPAYEHFWRPVRSLYENSSPNESQWVLITREIVPRSETLSYREQQMQIQNSSHQISPLLAMITCIFLEYAQNSVRLYGAALLRCIRPDGFLSQVRGLTSTGVRIEEYESAKPAGVLAARIFS